MEISRANTHANLLLWLARIDLKPVSLFDEILPHSVTVGLPAISIAKLSLRKYPRYLRYHCSCFAFIAVWLSLRCFVWIQPTYPSFLCAADFNWFILEYFQTPCCHDSRPTMVDLGLTLDIYIADDSKKDELCNDMKIPHKMQCVLQII